MKMPSIKRKILLIGAPAILVAGGLTTMAASAATPTTTPSAQTQPSAEPSGSEANAAETAAEPANTAAEAAAEASESALPGGGHADVPGQNVGHQFDGVE